MEMRLCSQLPASWQREARAYREVAQSGREFLGEEKTSNLVPMAASLIADTGQGRHEEAEGKV
jgi:hypothetical protein